MESHGNANTIEAVERSLTIIDTIQELDGARVTEVADNLGWAPSTVHSHMKTLRDNQYLVKEGDFYHIGLQFLNRGGYARQRRQDHQMGIKSVDQLATETNEVALFVVEEHGRGIHVHAAEGHNAVRINARIGRVNYLHQSSSGKAILANLPEQETESIIDRWGLPASTEQTITNRDELFDELETIRERGVSFNREESTDGLYAVGVPVLDANKCVIGAFSVAGPKNRLKGKRIEEELPNMLLGVANEFELRIAHS